MNAMDRPAAIAGSFSDFKLVRTRSTAQLIIEIPIEAADEALRILGGVPQSGKENPVAVARLNPATVRSDRTVEPAPQAPEKPASGTNGDGAVLPKGGRRAREAGIACGDVRFWRYLGDAFATDIMCADNAASYVRKYCGVTSRAELDHNPSAGRIWDRLHAEYLAEST